MNVRRVLGTMVALMLMGSGFGLLGVLVVPERNAYRPLPREIAKRIPESARQLVQPISLHGVNPAIKVIAHCNNGRHIGALRDGHHVDGGPFTGVAASRNPVAVQTRCDGPERRGGGRL